MLELRNDGLCGRFNKYGAICSSGHPGDRGCKLRCDLIIDIKYEKQTMKLTEFEIAAG